MVTHRRPELSDHVRAINETAVTARNVLTALLAVALSLGATILSTSDLAIFRGTADVLPSLGVKLPLPLAYTIAPPIFFFLHINSLLQLQLLAQRISNFETALQDLPLKSDRSAWRNLLHGFSFVQFVIAPTDSGTSDFTEDLTKFVVRVSLIFIPTFLLLSCQVSAMKLQNPIVFVVQFAFFVLDVIIIVWFDHAIRHLFTRFPNIRSFGRRAPLVIYAFFTILLASHTVPLRQKDSPRPESYRHDMINSHNDTVSRADPRYEFSIEQELLWSDHFSNERDYTSGDVVDQVEVNISAKDIGNFILIVSKFVSKFLFSVFTNEVNIYDNFLCNSTGRFCRYLVLSNRLLTADARSTSISNFDLAERYLNRAQLQSQVLDLRGRSFKFALFNDSTFVSIDLTDADLTGATLDAANIHGSMFIRANMQNSNLVRAKFLNTDLEEINMENAIIFGTIFDGANLKFAKFTETDIDSTDFSNTKLEFARFQGARISNSQFINADISYSHFDRTILFNQTLAGSYGIFNICPIHIFDYLLSVEYVADPDRPLSCVHRSNKQNRIKYADALNDDLLHQCEFRYNFLHSLSKFNKKMSIHDEYIINMSNLSLLIFSEYLIDTTSNCGNTDDIWLLYLKFRQNLGGGSVITRPGGVTDNTFIPKGRYNLMSTFERRAGEDPKP